MRQQKVKNILLEGWKVEDSDELKRYRARKFITIIGEGIVIDEFTIDLYFKMIEKITVFGDEKVVIGMLHGTEVGYIIEQFR